MEDVSLLKRLPEADLAHCFHSGLLTALTLLTVAQKEPSKPKAFEPSGNSPNAKEKGTLKE